MKHSRLKKLAFWLLEYTCPPSLYEEVRGDLEELYHQRSTDSGETKAALFLLWEALTSVRLQSLVQHPKPSPQKAYFAMFSHYIKIALRNIKRHKSYHFLNIGGLAIGLASFLMIALYVQHETSYNTWMDGYENIYRVPMEISSEGNTRKFSLTAGPLAPALEQDYPQIETTLRLLQRSDRLVKVPDGTRFYEGAFYTEPAFFDFFTLDMLEGDPATALERPNTVVLEKEIAGRFFGNQPALGQTLVINDSEYEVTGVMQNTPENTGHDFNMLMSMSSLGDWNGLKSWHWTIFHTYVKLHPGTDVAALEQNISNIANNYVADDLKRQKQEYTYSLFPISDIHLHSNYDFEDTPTGSATTVYIFGVIGILILLIAGLNFVNLSTARSEIRAKEVGMRKVLGARRFALVKQHMGEALLFSFISLLIALLLFVLVLPWYNELVGINFSVDVLLQPRYIAGLLAVTFMVGLGAGLYPALVLSSFSPMSMFRNKSGRNKRGTILRRVLVVSQFAISVILIVGTITVYKQLNFMMDKELGFTTDQMLAMQIRGGFSLDEKYKPIKDEFGGLAAVESVTLTSSIPGWGSSNYAIRIDREQNDMTQSMNHLFVEYDFVETYGLEIIAGRDFAPEYGNDRGGTFLINEAAVKSFGWSSPEEALGKILQTGAGGVKAEVIGVFKNFHYRSVDQAVQPLVLLIQNYGLSVITLHLKTNDMPNTIAQVKQKWASLFPDKVFEYLFVDDAFNAQYDTYKRTGRILFTFSLLAIFIACLGLYGLAAFSAQRRIKEIGIRKVLGATVSSLTFTVSKNFLMLVLTSVGVAIPVSWWLVHSWLQQFAYRITPDPLIFLAGGLLALAIAVITVSWQSIKAALANPVNSLRSE